MFDRSGFWPAPLATGAFCLETDGLVMRDFPELPQTLVSGDLDAFLAAEGMAAAVGLLGEAGGARYAVRLARSRLLAVGIEPETAGWNPAGYALTPMGAALAVIEITGPRWREFVTRATPIDPDSSSASAAFLLGDELSTILTRHGRHDTLRLHVSRPYLSLAHDWLAGCMEQIGAQRG